MDSPEGKEYVVTISVPSQEGVKARIATLEAAFQDESADVEMVGELAARYSHAGRMLDAMRCLEAGIARLPADANLYGLLGKTLMKLGRHAEALLQFKRALEVEPNRAGAYCGLAICLSEMGDDDDALQHFLLAADLDPLSVGHQQNLGRALAAADRLVESAACWERAIEMDASDSRGLIFLGVLYDRLGDPEKAESRFAAAARVSPDDAETHENWGRHVAGKGDHERAISILQRAVDIEGAGRRFELLGGSLAELSRWVESENCFSRAAELEPEQAQYQVNLGICQANQGRYGNAIVTLSAALALDPSNPLAKSVLGSLQGQVGTSPADE